MADGLAGALLDVLGAVDNDAFSTTEVQQDLTTIPVWTVDPQNWYQVFPYSFEIVEKSGDTDDITNSPPEEPGFFSNLASSLGIFDKEGAPNSKTTVTSVLTYTLPIPPQQLQISQIPATRITPTVGGVVEETSQNVFWTIQMAGTTGTAVSRDEGSLLDNVKGFLDGSDSSSNSFLSVDRSRPATIFRDRLQTTGLLSGIAANLNQVVTKVGGVIDSAVSVGQDLANGDVLGAASDLSGALTNAFLPSLPYGGSAVSDKTNGFSEAQALMQFFYIYSALKEKHAKDVSLRFTSFKTNQQWDCSVTQLALQQNAQSPHLYRYTIGLKCWNVRDPEKSDIGAPFDRFGKDGDLKAVNTMGLANTIKFAQASIAKINGEGSSTQVSILTNGSVK